MQKSARYPDLEVCNLGMKKGLLQLRKRKLIKPPFINMQEKVRVTKFPQSNEIMEHHTD